jgi:hypothetical protein
MKTITIYHHRRDVLIVIQSVQKRWPLVGLVEVQQHTKKGDRHVVGR